MMPQTRPQTSDYGSSFANYVSLVPDGDFLETLQMQLHDFQRLLGPLTDEQGNFRYAEGKWSIKEILGHISDAERIFAYRLLRVARGDQTPLPGFEQDDYIKTANSGARPLFDLLEEWITVRNASITLITSLATADWLRRGTASGKEFSALAMAFIIAGHALHHQRILEERYLPALKKS